MLCRIHSEYRLSDAFFDGISQPNCEIDCRNSDSARAEFSFPDSAANFRSVGSSCPLSISNTAHATSSDGSTWLRFFSLKYWRAMRLLVSLSIEHLHKMRTEKLSQQQTFVISRPADVGDRRDLVLDDLDREIDRFFGDFLADKKC